MKKWLLILGMITCMAGLTACGNKAEQSSPKTTEVTQEQVDTYVSQTVSSINEIVVAGASEQYADDAVISAALDGWEKTLKDMGDYSSVDKATYTVNDDGMTINVDIVGTKRNATMEIVLDDKMNLASISTNVKYSFSELMGNAGLNTLLGMGTVFCVLILISLIISCFNFIPKIQAALSKKEKSKSVTTDGAVAQIIQNEEQAEDDFELIAVISAAIAASEGAAGSDGYVVRSIRRVR